MASNSRRTFLKSAGLAAVTTSAAQDPKPQGYRRTRFAPGGLPEFASFDWRAGLIAVVALALIFAFKRGIVTTLAVCGALGLALGLAVPL